MKAAALSSNPHESRGAAFKENRNSRTRAAAPSTDVVRAAALRINKINNPREGRGAHHSNFESRGAAYR